MKTMLLTQRIDDVLNQLTKHTVELERDNMLLKKLVRTLAEKMHTNDRGEITMSLTEEDAEFIKYACDKCDVFITVEGGGA